jgi:DnaK suppressor protein
MDKAQLEEYRQKLLELGKRYQGQVAGLANEAFRKGGGGANGNLSNTPVHQADLGTDAFEQEVAINLLENEGQRLEEIAGALRRIKAGTYGCCDNCGKDIPRERLDALPFTALCVDCASKLSAEDTQGPIWGNL